MKLASVAAFATMVVALFALWQSNSLFGRSLWTIGLQVGAVALMIWARATFGSRSFHAAANPTREISSRPAPTAFCATRSMGRFASSFGLAFWPICHFFPSR
ncbi:MAG: hypothetical protein WCE51_04865 [Chthoniobacterales bacterium]